MIKCLKIQITSIFFNIFCIKKNLTGGPGERRWLLKNYAPVDPRKTATAKMRDL